MKKPSNRGGKRPGSGRKSKSEEQRLIEKLTPLAPEAHKQLTKAVRGGQQWAIKMFFEYMYGKPVARTAITDSQGNDLPAFSGFAFLNSIVEEEE